MHCNMATSLFDEPSIASFKDYPTSRPFLNSDMMRSPDKQTIAYPESNSQAVLSALKGLQEKIHNLELGRSKAEKNLKSLAAETSVYKDLLVQSQKSSPVSKPSPQSPSTLLLNRKVLAKPTDGTVEVESQLRNADTRCRLLERQLENMRRMVQCAEKERSDALERQIMLERDRGRVTAENRDIQNKLTRMEDIQIRFEDLTSRKEKSEVRVKELEELLKVEEHQRKLIADKAAQYQTEAEANRILTKDHAPPEQPKQKKKATSKKKKSHPKSQEKKVTKKVPVTKQQAVRSAGQPHYRLNLADVPFITGTSTSPSHAVSANMQKLLHDLKHHSPLYCNDRVVCDDRRASSSESLSYTSSEEESGRGRQREKQRALKTEEDLSDLLVALQDEFGKMTFEHQVLAKQIAESHDLEVRRDLECELEALVCKMEQKGDQISTVRRHRAQLEKRQQQLKQKRIQNLKKSKPSQVRSSSDPRGTRRGRPTTHSASATRAKHQSPAEERLKRLAFLRDMRTVRSALRRDDLSWD